MTAFQFRCSCCGKMHEELPDLAFRAPLFWAQTGSAVEPDKHYLGSDLCAIGDDRFIRCVLTLPIIGHEAQLGWGVWVSQSRDNFELYADNAKPTPERVTVGYLANRLPTYPDTLNMIVRTHWTSDGKRPWVEPEPSAHPLFGDWKNGISFDKAVALAELVLHPRDRSHSWPALG